MQVKTETNQGVMTVTVEGEINTLTTPELSGYVADLHDVRTLIFDMEKVRYISSAGLRLFMTCLRTLKLSGGDMRIVNCQEFVGEIFSSVGYDRIIHVEVKKD